MLTDIDFARSALLKNYAADNNAGDERHLTMLRRRRHASNGAA